MSDNKFFIRCRSSAIKEELSLLGKKNKQSAKSKKILLKRIVANVTMGNNEMISLYPEVLQLYVQSEDLEMKKLCCYFFQSYSFIEEEVVSRNMDQFCTDLHSRNYQYRSICLKTLAYFNNKQINQKLVAAIKSALRNDHAADDLELNYKLTCIYTIGKLFESDQHQVLDNGLADMLFEKIMSENASIVAASVTIITYIQESITEDSKGFVALVSKRQVINLIDAMKLLNEFDQSNILNFLINYVPTDDAAWLVEKVLPFLQHDSTAVVLNSLRLIVYLVNFIQDFAHSVPFLSKRLGNSLMSLISKPSEIQFLVLRNIILLLLSKPGLITLDVSLFFCKYNDPIYIKDTKLEIIYLLANIHNFKIILKELEEYATEIDVQMSRKSIRAIGNLAIKLNEMGKNTKRRNKYVLNCIEILMNLATTGIPYVIQETIIVMKNIFRKYPQLISARVKSEIVLTFVDSFDYLDDTDSKSSFIWLIGNYSGLFPEEKLNKVLEALMGSFIDEDLDIQLGLLTAIVKIYLSSPKQFEQKLISLFQKCMDDVQNPDLRDRCLFYWRILSETDKEKAKNLLLQDLPEITINNDKLDPMVLQELELNIGTLASIYLKPVKSIFRLSKTKKLPYSEYLVKYEDKNFNDNESGTNSLGSDDDSDDEVDDSFTEKILKINLKSNIATIKSPRSENSFMGSTIKEDPDEYEYNAKAVYDKQKFLSPKFKNGSTFESSGLGFIPSDSKQNSKVVSLKRKITLSKNRLSMLSPKIRQG